jgi:large subunit ribosomal protein L18
MANLSKKQILKRAHTRVRKKVEGSTERPRLATHKTGSHIYAQIIDDAVGKTLAAASSLDKDIKKNFKSGANCEVAQEVGKLLAKRAKEKNISQVVFDRGGHLYHGRVKNLADAAREAGLDF